VWSPRAAWGYPLFALRANGLPRKIPQIHFTRMTSTTLNPNHHHANSPITPQIRNPQSEIRNPQSEIHHPFRPEGAAYGNPGHRPGIREAHQKNPCAL